MTITTLADPPAATAPPRPRPARRRRGFGYPRRGSVWTYGALLAVVAGSVFPLYWSVVVSSQTPDAVTRVPPALVPGGHLFDNIARVFVFMVLGRQIVGGVMQGAVKG